MLHYISFAVDENQVGLQNTMLIVGPNCNASRCRNNIPSSFYNQKILTYVRFNDTNPSTAGSIHTHH